MSRGKPASSKASLDADVAALADTDLHALRARWQSVSGRPAPPTFRVRLLRAGIAYMLQERALGGLKPRTRRMLLRIAEAGESQAMISDQITAMPTEGGALLHRPKRDVDAQQLLPAQRCTLPPPSQRRRRPLEPLQIKPGTRLLRQWQGTTHEVLVTSTGVAYRGTAYRSLSEVARLITGQRWSGPVFFGVRRRYDAA